MITYEFGSGNHILDPKTKENRTSCVSCPLVLYFPHETMKKFGSTNLQAIITDSVEKMVKEFNEKL